MERVARVSEVIAGSPGSFDEAIKAGFERASRTLRNITGLRILEQRVSVEADEIKEYRICADFDYFLAKDDWENMYETTWDLNEELRKLVEEMTSPSW